MRKVTWRLKVLPDANGLAALVTAGVLTPEEARTIVIYETNIADFNKKEDK